MSPRRGPVKLERRPPVPPLARSWAFSIVRGSRRLSPAAKLLYGLLLELDRPDEGKGVPGGCYMGEAELARQLGAGMDHVSDLRTHLRIVGLVHRESVVGSRVTWWFPTLPPGLDSAPPKDIESLSRKERTQARRGWLVEQTEALDRYILEREETTGSPVTKGRLRHRAERRIPLPQFSDGAELQQRSSSSPNGGALAQPQGDNGGAPGTQRRNPPSSEREVRSEASTSDSLEIVSHRGELLSEVVNERSRSEVSATPPPTPADPEIQRLMEHHRRRRAEAVAIRLPTTLGDQVLVPQGCDGPTRLPGQRHAGPGNDPL